MPDQPRAVMLDIEGTTTPVAFVHQVLFPFARERLPAFLRDHAADPEIRAEVEAVRRAVPDRDAAETLLRWMDEDRKETSLKALQGLIWRQGYADGRLQGPVYPDVAPALRRWHDAGLSLFVYSSGSVEAQRLIFQHSTAGNLTGLFAGFFDTRTGPKRDPASYRAIASVTGMATDAAAFLSDVETELDAAAQAGLRTCQLVRTEDGLVAGVRHPVAATLDEAGRRLGLP